jgi:hypothetical protein
MEADGGDALRLRSREPGAEGETPARSQGFALDGDRRRRQGKMERERSGASDEAAWGHVGFGGKKKK